MKLNDATVGASAGRGFWLRVDDGKDVFVLPATTGKPSIHEGQRMSIEGVILQMPRSMRDRLEAPQDANTDVRVRDVPERHDVRFRMCERSIRSMLRSFARRYTAASAGRMF